MTQVEPSLEALNKLTKIFDALFGSAVAKVIFEFGSRYGEDTVEFAKRYPAAMVYAFECNPNTLPECRKNTGEYSNITLTEKAVSDTCGTVSFYKIDKDKTETTWEDGNQGASSLLKASGKYPVENYVQEEIKVESITLSKFIEDQHIPGIDILWMDIQGAELQALKGLGKDISKVKSIHIEVEFFEIYKDQPLFDEVKAFLNNADFELLDFSSQSDYSGDAIFVNKAFVSAGAIKKYRKANTIRSGSFFAKILSRLKNIIRRTRHDPA